MPFGKDELITDIKLKAIIGGDEEGIPRIFWEVLIVSIPLKAKIIGIDARSRCVVSPIVVDLWEPFSCRGIATAIPVIPITSVVPVILLHDLDTSIIVNEHVIPTSAPIMALRPSMSRELPKTNVARSCNLCIRVIHRIKVLVARIVVYQCPCIRWVTNIVFKLAFRSSRSGL